MSTTTIIVDFGDFLPHFAIEIQSMEFLSKLRNVNPDIFVFTAGRNESDCHDSLKFLYTTKYSFENSEQDFPSNLKC